MSRKYKFRDQQKIHFVTFTVIHWIDVFIRNDYRDVVVDSIKYCQVEKGLEVYAWVIMPSHIHMIIGTSGPNRLEFIVRDLKSFTSRHIRKVLENFLQVHESRREWLLPMMYKAGKYNSNNNDFQFWQQHSHPIELSSNKLMEEKLEYIHMNPVAAGYVDVPEAWMYSSARDYAGVGKGMVELVFIG